MPHSSEVASLGLPIAPLSMGSEDPLVHVSAGNTAVAGSASSASSSSGRYLQCTGSKKLSALLLVSHSVIVFCSFRHGSIPGLPP